MKSPPKPIAVMTTTSELYLPTRLVYEVYDVKQLRAWLQKTKCMGRGQTGSGRSMFVAKVETPVAGRLPALSRCIGRFKRGISQVFSSA